TWHSKSSKQIADCRVFTVREDVSVRDRDGSEAVFFTVENPNWVNVIALTAAREVVLIDQFRHGVKKTIIEIPGGMVDDGEDPLAAAKRELAEETGYTSDHWILLGKSYPNPAIQSNEIFHYLAIDCEKTSTVDFDDHESIVTEVIPLDEVRRMIAVGKISHSLVVAAFYYFGLRR
ncbi:MAG: NUDIX hydrolase, partial [Pyrinomonadaceae bacterium]